MRGRALRSAATGLLLAVAGAGVCAADWTVQVAVYAERAHVVEATAKLQKAGFPVVTETFTPKVGAPLIRLLVGPYPDRKGAEAIAKRLAELGWPGYVRRHAPAAGAPPMVPAEAPKPAHPAATAPPAARPTPAPAAPSPAPVAPRPAAAPAPAPPAPPAPEPTPAAAAEPSPQGAADDVPVPPPASAPSIAIPGAEPAAAPLAQPFKLFGYYQLEGAYTYPTPSHGSKFKSLLEAGASGSLSDAVRWKLSGRFWYDAIYDVTSFYSNRVADDARWFYNFRETYVDASLGDFDVRVGRQQIVWGEVVGLFFADVVSARELHEFLARDLDYIRIPQWALRVEWTRENFHVEGIWIPYMSYDRIGVPGSDFYPTPPPLPPGSSLVILNERTPPHTLANGAWGGRLSYLAGGFDTGVFYYDSIDVAPAFTRQIVQDGGTTFVYRPDHARIRQAGLTIAKDLGAVVVKAEGIYTDGRRMPVTRPSDADGLVKQNMIDAIAAVEWPFAEGARVNAQVFTRAIFDRDPDLFNAPGFDPGGSLDVSAKAFGDRLEAEVLGITSFKDQGWMARFKLFWSFRRELRLGLGADLFGGPETGFFGRYKNQKRYVGEIRYSF